MMVVLLIPEYSGMANGEIKNLDGFLTRKVYSKDYMEVVKICWTRFVFFTSFSFFDVYVLIRIYYSWRFFLVRLLFLTKTWLSIFFVFGPPAVRVHLGPLLQKNVTDFEF
jgi:hypothetical protein